MRLSMIIFPLIWLALTYAFSIALFMKGFLLNRNEIDRKSNKHDMISCCLVPKYRKVIFLFIDALHYDFALFASESEMTKDLPVYKNNLPVLKQLEDSGYGALYKFIADPPTTTMQRLKGLTTGSLPTFIDAGKNFDSNKIDEDNILYQASSSGFSVALMGDDTWTGLFPTIFNKSYPYPSFDVWDLDTVDSGVEQHLFQEIKSKNSNFLIAHCLGVDHCGHRYGPHHSEMKRKLLQMNILIQEVAASMDNDTLLLVMGDHGMTSTGDHGGDSSDEVTAAFFAYSHQWKVHKIQREDAINQVDLVPTVALLLGIPIPFSSLGSVNLDLIYPDHILNAKLEEEHMKSVAESYLCDALFLNVKQVWRYLEAYNQEKPLPNALHLEKLYRDIVAQYESFGSEPTYKFCLLNLSRCPQTKAQFILKAKAFLKEAKEMCSSIWANFDVVAMVMGLVVFSATLLCNYITFAALPASILSEFDRIYFTGMLLSSIALICLLFQFVSDFFLILPVSAICAVFLWKTLRFHRLDSIHCLVVPSLMAILYTSNSFVVEEPYVVHFAAQSLIWWPVICRKGKQSGRQWLFRVGLSFLVRVGLGFFRCREEQLPSCVPHQLHRSLSSFSYQDVYPAVRRLLLALLTCFSILTGFTFFKLPTWISIPWILICGHWIMEFASLLQPKWIHPSMLFVFPKVFYGVFIVLLCIQVHRIVHQTKSSDYRKEPLQMLATLSALGTLLAGDGLAPSIGLILASLFVIRTFLLHEREEISWPLYGCLSLHGFFATGHHTSLAAIPWETAFVGLSQSGGNVLPALLVSYSTAFSALLHPVALVTLLWNKNAKSEPLGRSWLYLLLFYAIRLFGCMNAALIHRRHLMVWKIFAPRLLYELLLTATTAGSILFSVALYTARSM